jgi:hypothetical protein
MKYPLTIRERYLIGTVVGGLANAATWEIIEDLQKRLSFTEQEHKDHQIIQNAETGRLTWAKKSEFKKFDIEIGDVAMMKLKSILTSLDKNEQLTNDTYQLWKRFVATTKKEKRNATAPKTQKVHGPQGHEDSDNEVN